VYKGRLRQGNVEVAVKVQRPGVREAIALDLYILRWVASELRTYRRLNSDLPRLLDEWAASLFRELDYQQEAANGARFAQLYSDLEVRRPLHAVRPTGGRQRRALRSGTSTIRYAALSVLPAVVLPAGGRQRRALRPAVL
jgi:ABC1 atypical kinase-like domain